MALAALPAVAADAQQERRGGSPLMLPRPGLDPVVRTIGTTEVRLSLDVSTLYDSNVYATSTAAQDDFKVFVQPRVELDWRSRDTAVHVEGYGDFRRHFDLARENNEQFGVSIDGSTRPAADQLFTALLRYDRATQLRTDPEARVPITAAPRRIDIFTGEASYSLRGGPFQVRLTPGVERYHFLDQSERDRNLKSYRGAARVSYQRAAPVAFFLEGFATRRDFDLARDFSGVDRDATTYGVLLGASREESGRLRGAIGIGVFRANVDDPLLRSYTGVAIDGRVIWSPRARTAVTFEAFRGDVATVRAGASGRTDMRASLRIDQEARHNLLLFAQGGWRRSVFRGTIENSQDVFDAQIGGEYLMTRSLSAFASAAAARRNATIPLNEFSRTLVQVGVRARY